MITIHFDLHHIFFSCSTMMKEVFLFLQNHLVHLSSVCLFVLCRHLLNWSPKIPISRYSHSCAVFSLGLAICLYWAEQGRSDGLSLLRLQDRVIKGCDFCLGPISFHLLSVMTRHADVVVGPCLSTSGPHSHYSEVSSLLVETAMLTSTPQFPLSLYTEEQTI